MLDLDCFRNAVISLAHRTQFFVAKDVMLQVIPLHWVFGEGIISGNWVAKCLAYGRREREVSDAITGANER